MKRKLALALLLAALAATGGASAVSGNAETAVKPPAQEVIDPIETPAGANITSIAFKQVEETMRKNNPSLLAIEENMARLDAFNREKAYDDLLKMHNSLTDIIWAMSSNPAAAASMQQQQATIKTQMDALKADEYALTYEDSSRQIKAGMDQMVYMGESFYLQLITLEQTLADGKRGLAALDRQLEITQKAYSIGQCSEVELLNLKHTRASTASQLDTLAYNIKSLKMQLQYLLGAEMTGELTLAALPAVTDAQIQARNVSNDLGHGMAASLSIYQAKRTMDNAKEDLDDITGYGYTRKQAEHVYQSAQYSYQAACQNFKLSFNTLSAALSEKQRLTKVAQAALEIAQRNFDISALQYQRGQISQNDYKTAQDDLEAAKSAVSTANTELFTTYTQYNWAVRGFVSGAS